MTSCPPIQFFGSKWSVGFVRCLLLVATVVTAKTGQLGAQSLRLFKGNLELDAGRFRFPPSPHEETQVALSKRKPERSHLRLGAARGKRANPAERKKTTKCAEKEGTVSAEKADPQDNLHHGPFSKGIRP